MTSSLRIKNFKIDKFGDFSSDIDFKTKMDIFRDDISLIINQCHPQATEGSLRRSVRQPRSASKRSALVLTIKTRLMYIYLFLYTVERQLSELQLSEHFSYPNPLVDQTKINKFINDASLS